MGMKAEDALGAAIGYIRKSLLGLGALKGANCTIQSITYNQEDGTNTVVFAWKDNLDVSHTSEMVVHDGEMGQYVSAYEVSGKTPFEDDWLQDGNGTPITPVSGVFYLVLSEGTYYKTLCFFDSTSDEYVSLGTADESWIRLTNQSLTFVNGVATISDARITAESLAFVYFADSSITSATSAVITVDTASGVLNFTAENQPSAALTCDILIKN